MAADLRVTTRGETLILTVSNPEHRNALGPEIYTKGLDSLKQAADSPAVRSIVIVGEGSNFCAGGNLQRLRGNRSQPRQVQADSIALFHAWIAAIQASPKPIIAAVEGAAAGAGFSIALACDFIVSAEDAVYLMAYTNIGLSPDGGASWTLARSIPRQLANELLMCGERTSAQRLHALGVVNRVVPRGRALEEALELAARLNSRASNALASMKLLGRSAQHSGLHEQLELEREHFVANLHHDNAGIGIEAFLAKQAPKFS